MWNVPSETVLQLCKQQLKVSTDSCWCITRAQYSGGRKQWDLLDRWHFFSSFANTTGFTIRLAFVVGHRGRICGVNGQCSLYLWCWQTILSYRKKIMSHDRAIHKLQLNYHMGLLRECSFGKKVGVPWSKLFDTPRNSNSRNWIYHRKLNRLSSGWVWKKK